MTSATFALTMFLLILFGKRWDDFGQLAFTGIIVAVITLTGTLAVYAPIHGGGVQGVYCRANRPSHRHHFWPGRNCPWPTI